MKFSRNTVLVWATVVMVALSGCVLKKRRPPIPQRAEAPTITAPVPDTIPEETGQAQPQPQTEQPAQAEKTKPKHKRNAGKKPAQPAEAAQAPALAKPPRMVIQESGTQSQGQLTASLSAEEASHQRQSTQQLLESTQANLRSLRRQLTAEEQAMVNQIRDYVEQARKATADSDPVRARNLALKAHLLSDELVKR
jgi:hypothetical protein